MKDRTGETWQEDDKIFVVVGPPTSNEMWVRHPVCYLDDSGAKLVDEHFVDEGDIGWELQPYMQRIA